MANIIPITEDMSQRFIIELLILEYHMVYENGKKYAFLPPF